MSDVATQLPPADELAEVREKLKALQTREAELRQVLLADPSARTGNRYAVEVCEVTTNRTDLKELRAMYPAQVDEHTYPLTTRRVELRGINEDGELISLRSAKETA